MGHSRKGVVMAEYDEFDFEDDDQGTDLVKNLRKQVKELSSALKERDEYLQEFMMVTREQELSEALQEMGVNPRVAAFVPDDVEDMDDLEAWIGEYAEVFGLEAVDDEGGAPESVQAAELMSAVEEGGIDPTVGQSLEAKIQAASTPEELAAILKG